MTWTYQHKSFVEKNSTDLFLQTCQWMENRPPKANFKIIFSSILIGDFLWLSIIYRIKKKEDTKPENNAVKFQIKTSKKGEIEKMKLSNWFQIFKGERVGSSDQIGLEICEIDEQALALKMKCQGLRGELKTAGIERLAGGESDGKMIKLESEIRTLEFDIELLKEVRSNLLEKQSVALDLEKKDRIVEIDKSIKKLRAKRVDMQEEAVSLGSHLAALLFLTQGTHLGEVSSLLQMDHQRGVLFRAEAQAVIEGQIPIREQERHLMNEKKNLQLEIKGA